jgi:VIT1/CCC1 family predicted Fe2+/Mn2+ transporter
LISFIEEERLKYVSSMVLGLNDALVELSGALAGLTFAIQNAQIIAITGLITGIAAALSMASSEYLSTKAGQAGKEKSVAKKGEKIKFEKDPFKAAVYTGLIYMITVLFLIFPFLFLGNLYHSLAIMLGVVFAIIFVFTFYISVAMEVPFWKRFIETASISFGIAAISFGIGIIVRTFWGIQI